jgi:hypothetical protein
MTNRDTESALELSFLLLHPCTCLHGVMLDHVQGQLTFVRHSYPCNRLWMPIGLWNVEAPTFSRQSSHRWHEVVSLTHRPVALYTQKGSRLSQPQGHSAAGRIRSIEKYNDLTGNRTCYLPTCSTVPQPTTPTLPCSPWIYNNTYWQDQLG